MTPALPSDIARQNINMRKNLYSPRMILEKMMSFHRIQYWFDGGTQNPSYSTGLKDGIQWATHDDFGGSGFDLVIGPQGSLFIGFDRISRFDPYSEKSIDLHRQKMLKGLPESLLPLMKYLNFCDRSGNLHATFVLWRQSSNDTWDFSDEYIPQQNQDKDGLSYFMEPFDMEPNEYFDNFLDGEMIEEFDAIEKYGFSRERVVAILSEPSLEYATK